MPKGNDYAVPFVFVTLGVVIGAFSTIIIKKITSFGISNVISIDINPFDILSLIVTVGLAIYIAKVLDKKNQSESNRKTILIDYIKDFGIEVTRKISSHLGEEELDDHVLGADFKVLRKKAHNIKMLISNQKFLNIDNTKVKDMTDSIDKLWKLLTEVPRVENRSMLAMRTESGRRRLTLLRRHEIETSVVDSEQKILEVIFEINNC